MAQAATRDWPALLASAAARGLGVCELAREIGHRSPGAVSRANARAGFPLPRKDHKGGQQYEPAHKPTFVCPAEWGLKRQQAQFVAVLVDAEGFLRVEEVLAKITTKPSRALLNVIVCDVRAKLEPFGIAIQREFAISVGIDAATKAELRAGAVRTKRRSAPIIVRAA